MGDCKASGDATEANALQLARRARLHLKEQDGEPFLVGAIGVSSRGIDRIFFIMNPVKLGAVRDVPHEGHAS